MRKHKHVKYGDMRFSLQ